MPGLSHLLTSSSPTFLNTSPNRKTTHNFLYVGNSQNSNFGGDLPYFQLLVTFFTFSYAISWLLPADARDRKISFNKRNFFEFLVHGEIIKYSRVARWLRDY